MTAPSLVLPRVRVCAWFQEEPQDLAGMSAPFLDLAWGEPEVAFVEPLMRRRLSRLARGFFHCAQRLSPPGDVRVVFASQHGEADRTLAILRTLAAAEPVSPALFSMSVHNAVPGIWSIFKGNHAPMSALAAGPESFGWGLVEAGSALLAEPEAPVLMVFADDRIPEPWAAGAVQPGLHAVALLLGGGEGAQLTLTRTPGPAPGPAAEPQAHAFLRAWAAGGGVWSGATGTWSWRFE